MFDEPKKPCHDLPKVSPDAAETYAHLSGQLLERVNSELETEPSLSTLLGGNPFELMRTYHRNHAALMTAVFRTGSQELLLDTLAWGYRTYRARGVSYDYFPLEFSAWQRALWACLDCPNATRELSDIYAWMVGRHADMIEQSITDQGSLPANGMLNEPQQVLLQMLLQGDSGGCLTLADRLVKNSCDLKDFYLEVVCPVLYRIGALWESNEISVAEEHLATAIVGRVMASLYPFAVAEVTAKKAVVTAAPNELHEVGARMVAEFLEIGGWDVTYLGANTPACELLKILKSRNPHLLLLSVATAFNLGSAWETIRLVKGDPETAGIRVLVGGAAFNGKAGLWKELGADGYAPGADGAVDTADRWYLEMKA